MCSSYNLKKHSKEEKQKTDPDIEQGSKKERKKQYVEIKHITIKNIQTSYRN